MKRIEDKVELREKLYPDDGVKTFFFFGSKRRQNLANTKQHKINSRQNFENAGYPTNARKPGSATT